MSDIVETYDVCALPLVRRLAATLDLDPSRWVDGDSLPRGWHVALFTVDTPQSALRVDGMAGTGIPLPEVDLPRVVMGGRRLDFHADIPIGAPLRRLSRVDGVAPKQGRSGRLVVVTMLNEIFVADETAPVLTEAQDYIFLESAPAPSSDAGRGKPDERPQPDVRETVVPDEVLLFRYCAVTFNPHRIHFDWQYTTEVEGFPALVVNGGLTALLLTELFRRTASREPVAIATRNRRPLYNRSPIHLNAKQGTPWQIWAENDAGEIALEGTAQ